MIVTLADYMHIQRGLPREQWVGSDGEIGRWSGISAYPSATTAGSSIEGARIRNDCRFRACRFCLDFHKVCTFQSCCRTLCYWRYFRNNARGGFTSLNRYVVGICFSQAFRKPSLRDSTQFLHIYLETLSIDGNALIQVIPVTGRGGLYRVVRC
jgi:hypothetical protein